MCMSIYTITHKPSFDQIISFIFTTVQQFKQSVIKTEHSQEFQESLTTDKPALAHSVHLAHSPIYSLLNSVVYWCSQHSPHSLLHFATHCAVTHSAVKTRLPHHAALCHAVHHTNVHLFLSAALTLYNAYCTSRTYFSVPVSARYS